MAVGSGCREDTVRLSFRPSVGDRSSYVIEVRAVAVTTIGEEGARRTVIDRLLRARHRVLESSADGSRVEVRLSQERGPTATFIVRYDRAAQPIEVQRVEGLPADALGDLGLSELFPAAAAAPPDRPLEPGARWEIDEPVSVAGARPARLAGEGRLVALQAAGGRRLAHVTSSFRVPVGRTSSQANGRLRLEGSVATQARVAYDLDDDVVQSVRARTRGRYDVTLLPPPGVAGVPVPGTMDVDVDSTTRRLS
jgi:hypothetical protein